MNPDRRKGQLESDKKNSAGTYFSNESSEIIRQRRARLSAQTQIDKTKIQSIETGPVIKDIKAWVLREPVSKRTYTIVSVKTGSGITGYGECAELHEAEFSEAKKIITGMPVTSFEAIMPLLTGYPLASAGLNTAMLDATGKLTKAPVYQLLGGPTRFKARAITKLEGNSEESLAYSMKLAQAAGYRAFIVPVPSIKNQNQGQAYVIATLERLKTLRNAAGENVDFVLDGNNCLTPGDAQMISAAIEQFHVLWFNEPCAHSNIGSIRKLAGENVTPIGLGSFAREGGEIQDMLREDAVDIIRPDIGFNGISRIRRMAAIAETYYVAAGPMHDGGPVGTSAALHLAASIPNFFIQQIPLPDANEDRLMRLSLTTMPLEIIKDGFADLPIGPGLGISVNEKDLEKYSVAIF